MLRRCSCYDPPDMALHHFLTVLLHITTHPVHNEGNVREVLEVISEVWSKETEQKFDLREASQSGWKKLFGELFFCVTTCRSAVKTEANLPEFCNPAAPEKGFTLTMSMEYVEQAQRTATVTCSVYSRCFPRTLPCLGRNYLLTWMAVMDILGVEEGAAGHHDVSRCNEQFKAGWSVRKKGTRATVLCWPLEWWTVWGWGGAVILSVSFLSAKEGERWPAWVRGRALKVACH